jgi:signal transduction histidine kinase
VSAAAVQVPADPEAVPLASALRAAAARAARRLGDGVALVFARDAGDPADAPARLRAAAGFASVQDARRACETPELGDAVRRGVACRLGPGVLPDAPHGAVLIPLVCEGRAHGVLVASGPSEADEAARRALCGIAEGLALQLDHAHLRERAARLERLLGEHARVAEQKSEEVLELSEALFAQDIELLRKTEKLGKVEKLKNDFIEKMSRELRTPLNSIIEAIIQVLAGENEALSAPAQESLRRALDEGTSFLRTLQNILDLWRLKQGELPVEVQEVNFREVVEEAIFSVQDTLGDKPVRIEKRLAQPFPKLRTDLAKLNQILFLLLDNAAKFTNTGEIRIEARAEQGRLVCEVHDTGVGICPDDRPYVFDEFFQVDELSSTRYRGAGLGLTLVRDLVALLGGEVSLASEVGSGTTFHFEIPVQTLA